MTTTTNHLIHPSAGLAGGISRTVTAPMDRLKMIMMTQESVKGMSVREGMQQMAAEGVFSTINVDYHTRNIQEGDILDL